MGRSTLSFSASDSAWTLADAGQLERGEVGNGEARVGAADIGDDGLSRQRVLSLIYAPVHANAPLVGLSLQHATMRRLRTLFRAA